MYPDLANIRTRVRFYIDEAKQANFLDSDINYAINNAQQDTALEIIQVNENFFVNGTPTQLPTTVGVEFYPLPEDFWKLVRLENSSTGIVVPMRDFNDEPVTWNTNYPISTWTQGLKASIVGDNLRLNPTPIDNSLILQFWYVPILDDLINDTDQSLIPRTCIDLLAIQAAIDCFIKDEDDTSALVQKYDLVLNRLQRTTRDRQTQEPKRVRRVHQQRTRRYF